MGQERFWQWSLFSFQFLLRVVCHIASHFLHYLV